MAVLGDGGAWRGWGVTLGFWWELVVAVLGDGGAWREWGCGDGG